MNGRVLYKKISYTVDQFFKTYESMITGLQHHVLLESGRDGKYSIAGLKPFAIVKSIDEGIEIIHDDKREVRLGKPIAELEGWMEQFSFPPIEGLPHFQGGAIGYISYDYNQRIE